MTITNFYGETLIPWRDQDRLESQLDRTLDTMTRNAGLWLTLAAIAALTNAPEASCSARLRQLRKMGYTIERRYVSRGMHEYRLVTPPAATVPPAE